MIRIAFVVHGMQPGGIERSVTRIIGGLDRNCFEPLVICLDRSGPAVNWLDDDIRVIEIEKRPGNDLSAVRRLVSVLKSNQIHLVQSHNWGTLLETAVARKLARVPKHIHAERGTVLGAIDSRGWKQRFRAVLMRAALSSVDYVVSNSHAVATRVQDRCGYPLSRIAVIPNGVPSYSTEGRGESRRKVRQLLGIAEEVTLLGSVGRLHEVKGFDVLLRAMTSVCSGPNSVHLVIVGEGEQRNYLQRISVEEKISDRVHLVGHCADVASWLSALDVFINSSRSEGMSQSMIEAMSAGLPIVATDVGDARRLIRRTDLLCGEICPVDDAAGLAKSINTLLADKSTRRRYSQAALECHSKFYSETSLNESMEALYLQGLACSDLHGNSCSNPGGSAEEAVPATIRSEKTDVPMLLGGIASSQSFEKTEDGK